MAIVLHGLLGKAKSSIKYGIVLARRKRVYSTFTKYLKRASNESLFTVFEIDLIP